MLSDKATAEDLARFLYIWQKCKHFLKVLTSMCLHYFKRTASGCSVETCSVILNNLKKLLGKEGKAEEKQ